MKVVVFGASGKVGSRVVTELISKDHSVSAFVYGENPFQENNNLKVIQGSIKIYEDTLRAIKESDAVISTLGSWGTKSKDILSTGMQNIIPAMYEHGVDRIVSLTGSDAFTPIESPKIIRKITHQTLGIFAGKILNDGEEHIKLLFDSKLKWSVVRSPVMNNKGSEDYELSDIPCKPWETINRNSVAKSMVDILEKDMFILQSPFIHKK